MRSFYTTFDRDHSRIGFMKSNPKPNVVGVVDYVNGGAADSLDDDDSDDSDDSDSNN